MVAQVDLGKAALPHQTQELIVAQLLAGSISHR
jgi:hypothetical protein